MNDVCCILLDYNPEFRILIH